MGKKLLWIVIAVLGVACGEIAYLSLKPPKVAIPKEIKVELTPERVARGKYLVDAVGGCVDCHSIVDETKFAAPSVPGGYLKGRVMAKELGLPGEFSAANLTPDPETGIGKWSDGQVIRSIREGIGHDNRVLFPFMPYTEYKSMSDADVESIVAYLRSIPSARNSLPPSKIAFPVGLFIKTVPEPVAKVAEPNHGNAVEYGKYLTTIAGCKSCHTPVDRGAPVPGREFAGGHEFGAGAMKAVSYNLTPDNSTGLGTWTEEQFLKKFHDYKEYAEKGPPPVTAENWTVMPWLGYSQLERDDLKAIFAYLKTVPAISNAVETRPGAKKDKTKGHL